MSINRETGSLLKLHRISVSGKTVVALHNVDLEVRRGEIYGILGDNESGKSTLVNVLAGVIPHQAGTIEFDGKVLSSFSIGDAKKRRIETIFKQYSIVPQQTVFENLFMNRYLTTSWGNLNNYLMERQAQDVLAKFLPDTAVDVNKPLMGYNERIRNMVDVAKSFCFPAKLLILEEISSRLDTAEIDRLRNIIMAMKEEGVAVIWVSQHVDEIYDFADRVSVMRNGRILDSYEVSNYDKVQLVQMTYTHLYRREELEKKNFELYYSNSFNESIINYIPLSLIVTNTKGDIVLTNKLFKKLFNVSAESYWNQHYNELLQLSEEHLAIVKESIETGRVKKIYFAKSSLLSTKHSYVLFLIPFYDEDGAFLGIIFLFINYLDSIDFENQINLFGRMVSSEENYGKLVHKIRNPLGIIKNYLRIINDSALSDKVKENVDRIDSEVGRIKNIINEVGEILQSEPEVTRESTVDVVSLLTEIKEDVRHWTEDKHIRVKLTFLQAVRLRIDNELLLQVIMNIVINAIEAMPAGGCLEINDKTDPSRKFYIIAISDDGPGIEHEVLERVFEPFFSTKDSDEIRGLGLSICRDIMDRYGGDIDIESEIGRGTSFNIYFPDTMIV